MTKLSNEPKQFSKEEIQMTRKHSKGLNIFSHQGNAG